MFTIVFSASLVNLVTLMEYCIILGLYLVNLFFFSRLIFALFRREKRRFSLRDNNGVSNLLITNLICWLILLATALPHLIWMIANWRPYTRWIDAYWMFWSIMPTQCMMACLSFSVFFLTLDRIFTIIWLTSYRESHKFCLLSFCLLSLATVSIFNFLAFHQVMPLPELTDCNVFACLMTNGNSGFIVSKLVGSVLNTLAGAYFLLKWRQKKAKLNFAGPIQLPAEGQNQFHLRKIKADMLVLIILLAETFLNFLPQLLVLIIQSIILHKSIASQLGPHNLCLNALEGLITALIYRHTLGLFIQQDNLMRVEQNRGMMPNTNNWVRIQQLQQKRASSLPFSHHRAQMLFNHSKQRHNSVLATVS